LWKTLTEEYHQNHTEVAGLSGSPADATLGLSVSEYKRTQNELQVKKVRRIQYFPMPKILTELIAFISSPSDLDSERRAIQSAIEDFNPILSDARSVILRAISWDKDLLPGIGPDVQSVINRQIEGKYDIYIGLLGTRFGTPTPRALSGTEEEFDTAFKRHAASPESVRLLFYFKSTTSNLQQIDANQLVRVNEFRTKLGKRGLYKYFANEQELIKLVRDHLMHLILTEWDGQKWKSTHTDGVQAFGDQAQSGAEFSSITPNLTRPAFIDSMYIADLEIKNILQVFVRMKDAESHLWGTIHKGHVHSAQLKDGDIPGLKALFDNMAKGLAQYIEKIAAEGLALKGHLRTFIDALETAINLYFEENYGGPEYLVDAPAHLASLINGISTARDNLKQFRQILELMPNYTASFANVKRTAAPVFADLGGNMAVQISHLERILQDLLLRLQK
jgi:hypothetical protein